MEMSSRRRKRRRKRRGRSRRRKRRRRRTWDPIFSITPLPKLVVHVHAVLLCARLHEWPVKEVAVVRHVHLRLHLRRSRPTGS